HGVGEQPRHDERAAAWQFERGFRAANLQARHGDATATRSLQHESTIGGKFTHFCRNLQADAAFAQHYRREIETHTERLELKLHIAVAVARGGHGELATGEELRGLARDRRQVRFGKRFQDAVPLQHPDSRANGTITSSYCCSLRGKATKSLTLHAESIVGRKAKREVTKVRRCRKIDAKLLDDIALHLGD